MSEYSIQIGLCLFWGKGLWKGSKFVETPDAFMSIGTWKDMDMHVSMYLLHLVLPTGKGSVTCRSRAHREAKWWSPSPPRAGCDGVSSWRISYRRGHRNMHERGTNCCCL